jgi:tRNA nucleotidyltransferase/poly(A) polymerase
MESQPAFTIPHTDLLLTIRDLKTANQKVYLVGGAVRDMLLGRVSHDLDFVASGNIRQLARTAADRLGGAFYMLDDQRQVARVIWRDAENSELFLDFSALRGTKIEEDLRLRDFSLNAIALDLEQTERLIDPCGGARDLTQHSLRMCSEQSFEDDPLRVLRAVRFADRYSLRMEPATRQALKAAIPFLNQPSAERCRDEIFKIFESANPIRPLKVLDQLGILDRLFPELTPLRGLEQSKPHLYDVFEHTLRVVDGLAQLYDALVEPYLEEKGSSLLMGMAVNQLGRFRISFAEHFATPLCPGRSRRSLLFFGALFHDAAKPEKAMIDAQGNNHFYGHDGAGAVMIEKIGQRFALSTPEISCLTTLVKQHMRVHHLAKAASEVSRRSIYHYFRDSGDAGVDICLLSLADVIGREGVTINQANWERELTICRRLLTAWFEEKSSVVDPPRLINGNDLMGRFALQPGPLVGELLETIREAQAAGQIETQSQALHLAEEIIRRSSE